MEKFDIIVRPINDPNTDVVYMPCMIETVTIDKVIADIGAKDWKKTSWFYLEFDFLPPSYFNHILACFVKEMKLWTKKDNQLCIYRNIGLFDINEEFTKVLIVCLSTNSIGMQVRQWKGEDCYSNIKDKLIDLVHSMKLRYRMNILYKKKFKCSNGIYYTTEGRVDYDTLLRSSEYNCLEHAMIHSTKEIYRSWITVC
ncbi:unnamed protein product [Mytilus edulis]|uniref:Uncharacterized protein n=1 Tax=Mytilus edulis TaxID=6550 RepID=A0A8S3QC98_MYTED|nr:unnamed protein product [Mytilus edulis]